MLIIGKYIKIKFKNRGSPYYFLSSRGQKIENTTKIELFLFKFFVSFFMACLAQKLIYTINIWFNFVLGSFFEQDHLLSLLISGVYAKRGPKCARITKTDVAQNVMDDFFFLTLIVREPFHRKDLKWTERKQPPVVIL